MAGLGTSMDNGEAGMLGAAPRTDPQVGSSNPGEISHTTAMEDVLFLLYRDWVYLNRFTIDTTMLPGHVFAIIPIHPKRCHQYVRHVSEMFNGWTGTMGIRTRFMANAFNGGSFRIGWLPPNLTMDQIHNMSLPSLTAYPNQDLDPKNTEWTHYKGEDERNVMFHWMTDDIDPTRPESFGGYIVMYVAGSLVVGAAQSGTVSMIVESVGNFFFRQPSPLFRDISPIATGPLSLESVSNLFQQNGCDDFTSDRLNFGIQIFAQAVKSIPIGYTFASGVGSLPWDYAPSTLNPILLETRTRVLAGSILMANSFVGNMLCGLTHTQLPFYYAVARDVVPFNKEHGSYNFAAQYAVKAGLEGTTARVVSYILQEGPALHFTSEDGAHPEADLSIEDLFIDCCWHTGQRGQPIDTTEIGIAGQPNAQKLQTMQANESIVTFVNTSFRSINLQTEQMAKDLQSYAKDDTISYTYDLHAEDTPGAIRTLRLNPNGMFTTQAVGSNTLFMRPGVKVNLVYTGTLPVGSPLPPATQQQKSYWREVSRLNSKLDRMTPQQRINAFRFL